MLILASASLARAHLLTQAGVPFSTEAAALDEGAWKERLRASHKSASEAACTLAEEKAKIVSRRHREALVIGADQILERGGRWLDKPRDREEARAQLLALRGRTHTLATAVTCVTDERSLWRAISVPRLTMRAFSEEFLDAYLEAEGSAAQGSVGAYRLEGRGVQLFSRIEGDYFAVLGLPLVELLGFLRDCGVAPS